MLILTNYKCEGVRGTTASDIVDSFREQSQNLTQDQYAFDCFIPRRILELYNRENDSWNRNAIDVSVNFEENNHSVQPFPPVSPYQSSKSSQSQVQSCSTFPVYELVLNRFQAEEDELIPKCQGLVCLNAKERQLPNANSLTPKGSTSTFSTAHSVPSKVKWNDILENPPSDSACIPVKGSRDVAIINPGGLAGTLTSVKWKKVPAKISLPWLNLSVVDDMDVKEIINAATEKTSISEQGQKPFAQLRDNYFLFSALEDTTMEYVSVSVKSSKSSNEDDQDGNLKCDVPALEAISCIKEEHRPLKRGGKDMKRLCLTVTPVKSYQENCSQTLPRVFPSPFKTQNSSAFSGSGNNVDLSSRHYNCRGKFLMKNELESLHMTNSLAVSKCKDFQRKSLPKTSEYYSSDYILEEGLKWFLSRKKRAIGVTYLKPYVCPVPKCGKSYKNANGIKYHAKYGHSPPQAFPCHCGKLYSSMHSLLAHKKIHYLSGCSTRSNSENSGSTSNSDVSDCSYDCSREDCYI